MIDKKSAPCNQAKCTLVYTTWEQDALDAVYRCLMRLNSGHIFAGASINTYSIALIDKHRNLKFITGLDGCGLGGVGGGVAGNCGLANSDEEFDKVWRFNGER